MSDMNDTYRDAGSLVTAVKVMMWMFIVCSVLAICSSFAQGVLLQSVMNGAEITDEAANANDIREVLVALLGLVVFVPLGITYFVLLKRLSKNLHSLTDEPMAFSPGWAVGWHFVPIMNLIKPYHVMKELWNVAGLDQVHGSGIISMWWGCWLLGNILSRVSSKMFGEDASLGMMLSGTAMDLASSVLMIVAGVLLLKLVTNLHCEISSLNHEVDQLTAVQA